MGNFGIVNAVVNLFTGAKRREREIEQEKLRIEAAALRQRELSDWYQMRTEQMRKAKTAGTADSRARLAAAQEKATRRAPEAYDDACNRMPPYTPQLHDAGEFAGKGGTFDGGGASSDWDRPSSSSSCSSSSDSSSSSSDSGSSSSCSSD